MLVGECRMCNAPIRITFSPRRLCCSGYECGCQGYCLPDDICSEQCLMDAEAKADEERSAQNGEPK